MSYYRKPESLPALGGNDPVRPIHFAESYARLAAVASARAEFLGRLLAEAYEREGVAALVGDKLDLDREGNLHAVSEEVRGLARLEAEERDRAAKLIREGVRLGIEAAHVDVMRSYAHTAVLALRSLCEQMGIPWDEEATRQAAKQAIRSAREALGQGSSQS